LAKTIPLIIIISNFKLKIYYHGLVKLFLLHTICPAGTPLAGLGSGVGVTLV
jgi:hypothetical protein